VDLTRIEGIDADSPLTMVAEAGPHRICRGFKTVKHFASWLGLCPGTKISGGKWAFGSQEPAHRQSRSSGGSSGQGQGGTWHGA
jgi:transposase